MREMVIYRGDNYGNNGTNYRSFNIEVGDVIFEAIKSEDLEWISQCITHMLETDDISSATVTNTDTSHRASNLSAVKHCIILPDSVTVTYDIMCDSDLFDDLTRDEVIQLKNLIDKSLKYNTNENR